MLKLYLASLGRVTIPESQRRDHYLYIDEFQNFVATEGVDDILSEARKYRLCLVLAHQYLGQIDERLRSAIFGNVGTTLTFPVGPDNGHALQRHFLPQFSREDLVNQGRHHIYLRLAIDGITSKPFSAKTLAPFHVSKPQNSRNAVVRHSRETYATTANEMRSARLKPNDEQQGTSIQQHLL
jgi:hypothetical protein